MAGELLLSAVLIVRDEAAGLAACLASLQAVAEEVVVYDTGSVHGTPQIARDAGALVIQGFWNDDFARARNAAADAAGGRWLLVVDADERLVVDAAAVRHRLGDLSDGNPRV